MARYCIVRTSRLAATSWLRSDVEDLYAVHSDERTMTFVRHGRPESHAETESLIDRYIAEQAADGFTKWRLADLDDHLVGRAGFSRFEDGRELGYTIRREQWGHGLATEIAAALVRWHRRNAPGCPLYAYVAVENPASRRVLEKVGFTYVRPMKQAGVPYQLFAWT